MAKWEKVGISLVVRTSAYGNGVFVRIPKTVVDAYELKPRDNLVITVNSIRRFGADDLKSDMDAEADRAQWNAQDPGRRTTKT